MGNQRRRSVRKDRVITNTMGEGGGRKNSQKSLHRSRVHTGPFLELGRQQRMVSSLTGPGGQLMTTSLLPLLFTSGVMQPRK